MNYTQLRAFHAVARLRSVSRAAVALGLTQPAVTIQLRALEEAHRLKLFRRRGRELQPTEAGNALFAITQRLFAAEAEARELMQGEAALTGASLTLGADGPHLALDLLDRLRRAYPALKVAIRLGNSGATLQALRDQQVDAALLANPPADPKLQIHPVGRRDMMVLLPVGHKLAKRRKLELADLAGQPILFRERGSTTRRLLDRIIAERKLTIAPALELGSREALREAVARGFGIGFLFRGEAAGDSRLVTVPLEGGGGINQDMLICRKGQERGALFQALLAAAKAIGG